MNPANNMVPVPAPSFQLLSVENNYLRQAIDYQAQLVWHHQANAANLYHDAMRWRKFKQLLDEKNVEIKSQEVEKHVDEELAKGNKND